MNENDQKKGPGEAEGDGRAQHGYRNEVSWDDGKGFQPYTNQDEEHAPAAAHEFEAGNAGEVARRNIEQLEQVKRKEDPPVRESRRET